MTFTFSTDQALEADVLGARHVLDPESGDQVIALSFGLEPDGDRPVVLTVSICGAYHLREAVATALEDRCSWPADDEHLVYPSVRWDEIWADDL